MKKNIYMYISLHVFNSLSRNIGNLREKFEHRTFFFFLFFDLPMDTVCLFVLLVWSFFFSSFLSFLFLYIYIFFFGSKCTNADRYEKYYLLFRDITTEIWELDISRLIFFITSTNSGIKVGIERACFSNICVRLCMFTYIYSFCVRCMRPKALQAKFEMYIHGCEGVMSRWIMIPGQALWRDEILE